jgi:DNA polymerase III subunit chi
VTSIDFYTHVTNRLEVAAKLVAKAYAQHGVVRVLTPDAASTDALGAMLWKQPAIGFLPHCRIAGPLAAETPIWIDDVLDHQGPASVLINLHPLPPPFFARFERLAEIVGQDDVEPGRERYRYYRERGYLLRTHDLSEHD